MTSTNPLADPLLKPMQKLEHPDYKIRCAVRVLLDLTNVDNDIDPNSLDYIACALTGHSKELTKTFNLIHDAQVTTREA